MINCPKCDSNDVIKKGSSKTKKDIVKQRFNCKKCGANFYDVDLIKSNSTKAKSWVITSIINDTETNYDFLQSLLTYCDHNDSELLIIPISYNTDNSDPVWDYKLEPNFLKENVLLTSNLLVYANLKILATSSNPLMGFDNLSKGKSLIIPSPKLMMRTIARNQEDLAAILHTTGTISYPNYTNTKAGIKAEYTHSFSALIVEQDDSINSFHLRVLNADDNGSFYDLDSFYSDKMVLHNDKIPAIVLGDEHVVHLDDDVSEATFGLGGLVDTLNPSYIIRHDILDFYASNHHHKNDFLLQYQKHIENENDLEKELETTLDYIANTTPENSVSIIVDSNHDRALERWLNESNPKIEVWNAKLYHKLMYLTLDHISKFKEKPNALELWTKHNYNTSNIKFITSEKSFKICDIELALHGDRGINGSRGSVNQFSKLACKTIVGHSHSSAIFDDAYCVGTSSKLKLDYNKGPSSWRHAHCVIQPNGTRQIIFITNGKYKV